MTSFDISVDALTEDEARAELARLADILTAANLAYHQKDAPDLSDADYDAFKKRNSAIEARFPHLRRADSASLQVGAPVADGFGKVTHTVAMLSLANAFDDSDVDEFDTSIRKFLGLAADAPLAYTAEPKIDGLSLSLRYEDGVLFQAATRGDGEVGENVTQNALTIADVPAHIAGVPGVLEVRGEVYMAHADFDALNARQAEAGQKTSPRDKSGFRRVRSLVSLRVGPCGSHQTAPGPFAGGPGRF